MGKGNDTSRLYIMLFTLLFAFLSKIIIDTFLSMTTIPLIVSFIIAPAFGLLLSKRMFEKKFDWKELGIFALMMLLFNFGMQLIPSLRELQLFNLMTTTTIGLIGTFGVYFVTILLSVALSDAITDKRKIF